MPLTQETFVWRILCSVLSDLPCPDSGLLAWVQITNVERWIDHQLKLGHHCKGGDRILIHLQSTFFHVFFCCYSILYSLFSILARLWCIKCCCSTTTLIADTCLVGRKQKDSSFYLSLKMSFRMRSNQFLKRFVELFKMNLLHTSKIHKIQYQHISTRSKNTKRKYRAI